MEKILDEFVQVKPDFVEYCDKVYNLIRSILKSNLVNVHQVTSRVKEFDSLKNKIESKAGKYTRLSDITDIVGVRIITYFEDEVDIISQIIEQEFHVDHKNSVDKRILEVNTFGYKSLHYVVSLSESRNKLPEYQTYSLYKAEIQIRSILQHSWAEIEHDLGYKSNLVIPDVAKRSFYRISALLEVADIEFVNLKMMLSRYKEEVKAQIVKSPSLFSLDQDTLIEFMNTNDLFISLQKKIRENSKLQVTETYGELRIPIETFQLYSINTIEDLISAFSQYSNLIYKYCVLDSVFISVGKAEPIHLLAEILMIINNNKELYDATYYAPYTFEDARRRLNSVID